MNQEPDFIGAEQKRIRLAQDWIVDVLAKPHKDLGRPGAICPFIQPALEKNRLDVTATDIEPGLENFQELLMQEKDAFAERAKTNANDKDRIYDCRIIVCECDSEEHAALMDEAQASVKIAFMNEGFMVSQFHPHMKIAGLHNKKFRPFQSPVFCFAIRHMISGDVVFLDQNLAATQIPAAIDAYRQRFELSLPNANIS